MVHRDWRWKNTFKLLLVYQTPWLVRTGKRFWRPYLDGFLLISDVWCSPKSGVVRRLIYHRIGFRKPHIYIGRSIYPRIGFFNPCMYIRWYELDFVSPVCVLVGTNRVFKTVFFSSIFYGSESAFESCIFLEHSLQVRIGFWKTYIYEDFATGLNRILKAVYAYREIRICFWKPYIYWGLQIGF